MNAWPKKYHRGLMFVHFCMVMQPLDLKENYYHRLERVNMRV